MLPVYRKMRDDSNDRLSLTLNIHRACRFFGYAFIAATNIHALDSELVYLQRIPHCVTITEAPFCTELAKNKELTDAEMSKPVNQWHDAWIFWQANELNLPIWYLAAADVALVTPSSCTVERLFSLLTQAYDRSQTRCLQDYKETGVLLRFNQNWRSK